MTFSTKHKSNSKPASEPKPKASVPEDTVSDPGVEKSKPEANPPDDPASAPDPTLAPDAEGGPATESQPSEADRLKDRLLRLQADFDNYRKRMARERQDMLALANADLLASLLTPLDHMDRAISLLQESAGEDDAFLQGIRLVRTEWFSTMERFGLKAMDGLEGTPFDPTQQEAMAMTPAPGVDEGHVASVVRAGYTLNGRVLRAAQVMVARGPDPEPAEPAPESGLQKAAGEE